MDPQPYAIVTDNLIGEASVELLRHKHVAAEGFVYVLASCDNPHGPVKIGWAVDPVKRMFTLQTGNPHEVKLVEVIPGSRRSEAALHAKLRKERVRGEWFGGPRTREMVALIAAAASECLRHFQEIGRMPSEEDVFDAMGFELPPPLPKPRLTLVEPAADPESVQELHIEPEDRPDEPEYIVVGETAGPPPGPRSHRPYQRPMQVRNRGGRGGMG